MENDVAKKEQNNKIRVKLRDKARKEKEIKGTRKIDSSNSRKHNRKKGKHRMDGNGKLCRKRKGKN